MSIFELLIATEVFSPPECESIIQMYHDRTYEDGLIQDERADYSARIAQVQHVPPSEENAWVFGRLQGAIVSANQYAYNFELAGFREGFQFTRYDIGGHYRWHVDLGLEERMDRKLSLTVQLSDEKAYDGGELQFFPNSFQAPKGQGVIAIFPSFVPHRVTPVTRGTRFSLVSWVAGEAPFR